MTSRQPVRSSTDKLPKEMIDLIAAIGTMPTGTTNKLQPLLDRVVEGTRRRKRILSLVQEALGQLRLDMKYLMFDLEATRRERDALHAELHGDSE